MSRGSGELRGNDKAEVRQQADDIAAPANGNYGSRQAIFKEEKCPHDPGDKFAQRSVAVCISRTRHGQCRGEFCVA